MTATNTVGRWLRGQDLHLYSPISDSLRRREYRVEPYKEVFHLNLYAHDLVSNLASDSGLQILYCCRPVIQTIGLQP
jgi:hypothetical protein